ncbi:hypothetical protein PENTCL1PPCAC_14004, partial [Pristionchus entomophagus]
MGDFDTSHDYQLAGTILFPMAVTGFTCNFIVIIFLNSMPSLNNSFGSLTLSQALVDCAHQLMLAFYLAPTIYYKNKAMYALSDQFGFAILLAYQLCCFSHVCISINRFTAVYVPLAYSEIFRRIYIYICHYCYCWAIYLTLIIRREFLVDCTFYVPYGTWIFTFKETPSCYRVKWYGDFTLNSLSVVIVAILDISAILKLHCMSVNHTDSVSRQRRSSQINLAYQAAFQGIFFITELITYFLLSSYSRDKWEAYALTTISWCLVNGMDG